MTAVEKADLALKLGPPAGALALGYLGWRVGGTVTGLLGAAVGWIVVRRYVEARIQEEAGRAIEGALGGFFSWGGGVQTAKKGAP